MSIHYRIVTYLLIGLTFGLNDVLVSVIPQDPGCQEALGIESGVIKNGQFKFTPEGHRKGNEPYRARLNGPSAYCTPTQNPEAWYENTIYFTIDLIDEYKITGFALQGWGEYGTGRLMKLYTSSNGGHEYVYTVKNCGKKKCDELDLKDVHGDSMEYFPISPLFATRLKIVLTGAPTVHCLRMEVYGCESTSFEEYNECKKEEGILSKFNENMKFTQTDAHRTGPDLYNAKRLLFNTHFAWCLMTQSVTNTPFKEWATVDLTHKYLIYGIQVAGYLKNLRSDVSKRRFIAKMFKFRYSLDDQTKRDLEGRKELSTLTYGTRQVFGTPLIAKYVYISMKNIPGNLTCIKLELYGCRATLLQDPVTTESPIIPTNTTKTEEARINRYHIYQGNILKTYTPAIKWFDTAYNGNTVSGGELNNGVGCLIDKNFKENDNPFRQPECWIGWRINKTKEPYIHIVLTRPITISGIRLRTYVNDTIKASPIRKISVSASKLKPTLPKGSICSPDEYYKRGPSVIDYVISFGVLDLQYLDLRLHYSGEWMLVRQLELIKPGELPESYFKLQEFTQECPVPVAIIASEDKPWQVTVIVIIVLVMLLLVLVAFIIHHYRTSMHKKFHSSSGQGRPSIIVQDQHSSHGDNRGFITSDPSAKGNYTKVQYSNNKKPKYNPITNTDEGIYDNVDDSFDSGVLSDPQQATYADCEDIRAELYSQHSSRHNTPNGTMLYSLPDIKVYAEPAPKVYTEPSNSVIRQYAEPDTMKRESVIYQGSIIYATSYENPYRATVASTLYAEPSKLSQKGQIRVFPRNQLAFKEKIGVGQFGEVHIAEASGLDEIYGSIGHFNSWGLPDTSLVAVKLLKSVDSEVEQEFMKEVEVMATLKDENVVRLLGVCYEQPKLMVVEYMENGDLNQFLKERRPAAGTHSRTCDLGPLVLVNDQLIHMAQQIASGMKYLHSVGFIHRDLATRNCLVGPAYQVKIADFGMSRYVFTKHYYRVEGKAILPIRWMAPECIYYGKFTRETDVWSFGVTLWEIFSFARESPYSHMSDPQVIEIACEVLQNSKRTFPYLSQPQSCSDDVYDLVKKCWTTQPKSRPNFQTLCTQLLQKCTISEVEI